MLELTTFNNIQTKVLIIDRSSLLVLDYNRNVELDYVYLKTITQEVHLTDLFHLQPSQITDILTKDNVAFELDRNDPLGNNVLNKKILVHVTQFKSHILLTYQEKTETIIEQVKQDLHSILENIPLGIVYLDSHGVIKITNPALVDFLGSDPFIPGKYFFDLPMLITSGLKQLLQPCLNGEHITLQGHQYTLAGQENKIITAVEGVPVFDTTGHLLGILIIFEDVSELDKLTQRLI